MFVPRLYACGRLHPLLRRVQEALRVASSSMGMDISLVPPLREEEMAPSNIAALVNKWWNGSAVFFNAGSAPWYNPFLAAVLGALRAVPTVGSERLDDP